MNGDLPQGWANIALGTLTKPTRPRRDPQASSHLPFVGMEQVESYTRRLLGTVPASEMRSTAFHFQPNDVLYGRLRPYLNKVVCPNFEGLCSSEFIVMPQTRLFESKYLAFYLSTDSFVAFANQLNQGDRPRVSFDQIAEHDVPLAPLEEQRLIVAKLEILVGKVDACQQHLAKLPTLLKRFRQSVLAAACSGRLTVEWRDKNLGDVEIDSMLSSIEHRQYLSAKTSAQKEKFREIFSALEDGNSEELPNNWRFVRLNKLATSFNYGTSAKSKRSGKIPVLRMGNLQGGKLDWSDLAYTSDVAEIRQYSLSPQTVLFNRTNSPELVGKTAIYRGERPAIFAGYLIRINPHVELNAEYLNLCLNTSYAREFCASVKTDGVSQSNINAQKLGTFEVPFCHPAEQQEIVRRVGGLFSLADKIEARFKIIQRQVDRLPQSILAKAFRGELVPTEAELAEREGRPYESAEQLLRRIQSSRDAAPAS